MKLEEAKKEIDSALMKKELLSVVGNCYVEYWGRAASKLHKGKRMLLIKGDNSFAIHQNKLLRPINYMMNASIGTKLEEDSLNVTAVKKKPKEKISVKFFDVDFVKSFKLDDKEDLRLFGSERELSKELMQDLSFLEDGLKPLNQEEVFRKGIVDILAEDREGNLVIVEVKRRQADYAAVSQLQRYMKQVEKIKERKCRGILIAPSIGKNAHEMLEKMGLEFFSFDFEIDNPKAKIKGIKKKQQTIDKFL